MTPNNEENKNDTIVNDGANSGDVTVTEESNGETVVVTQEILDENPVLAEAGVQVGDIGVPTDEVPEGFNEDEVAEADNSVANYRMLHPTNRKDASGTEQTVPAGAIVELPVVYGDSLVAQGQAELVEDEEVVE